MKDYYYLREKSNKEKVYELSKVGQTLAKPDDILKEPYFLNF